MSEKKITIYLKPTCTTCKKAVALLEEEGVDFDRIDYYKQKLSKKELTGLIKKLNINPKDILRKRATEYSELGLEQKKLTLSEIVNLVLKYPDLLVRPIVICGEEVFVARPAEKLKNIIS